MCSIELPLFYPYAQFTLEFTQKTTQKRILDLIVHNPNITRNELAEACQVSPDGIKWQLKRLQDMKILRRVGPDKGGHWEIVSPENS